MARKRQDRSEGPAGPATSSRGLYVLAFTAGTVLMALEIVGSRILAPHFGNSVFVWGSLISVFLTALAGGYYVGGRIADRRPSFGWLAGLGVGAGLLILLVPAVGHPVCRWLAERGLGERAGPLAASTVLFLPASFILGMISPFSVRLATRAVTEVGRVAGTLYALSTVGSIVGTLGTTFLLIPKLETTRILAGLGAVMVVVSVAVLALHRRLVRALAAAALGAMMLALPPAPSADLGPGETLIFETESAYHHIRVVEHAGRGQRFLRFDRFDEGGVGILPPHHSALDYTDYFQLAFVLHEQIESALFLGAGAGAGPRAFHRQDPSLVIDVVDIDPRVLDIAAEHFHMPTGGTVTATARDARSFLNATDQRWDIIVLDAFGAGGRMPFHLVTVEFFELCRERLRPGGLFLMNVNGTQGGDGARIYRAVLRTLGQVFETIDGFGTRPPSQPQAMVLVARTEGSTLRPSQWRARLERVTFRDRHAETVISRAIERAIWPLPDVAELRPYSDELCAIDTIPLGF